MPLQTLLWTAATLLATVMVAAAVMWQRRLRTDVPGPAPLPLIGNILEAHDSVSLMRTVKKAYAAYGTTFRMYAGPKLFVFVSRPEDLERVLGDPRIEDRDRYLMNVVKYFIGDGLLTAVPEKWKSRRKLIVPTFHTKVLESFVPVFNEGAFSLADRLEKTVGLQVPIHHVVGETTGVMISETVMGGSPTDTPFTRQDLLSAIEVCLPLVQKYISRPWLLLMKPLFYWTKDSRDLRKVMSIGNIYIDSLIKQQRARIENEKRDAGFSNNCACADSSQGLPRKRQPFLELMLRSENGHQMSDEDLRAEVQTLLLAGYETTATTLSFTLALLGLHTEWQRMVHQELGDVFGSEGDNYHRPVTPADLMELKLLERVIKESLRLFPPGSLLPRHIPMDIRLGSEGYKVPAGSCGLCLTYFTHRQPESFPEPNKFDPDRFLPENSARLRPYSYVPFGAGAKNCVGGRFAMMQMKTVLATVLRRFTVLPGSTMEELEDLQVSITIKPMKDIRVTFLNRTLSAR